MQPQLFDRALVIRGGALGDFLLTLPVLNALRGACPQAHLEVLAYPSVVALAAAGGLINGSRSIEYGPLAGFFTTDSKLDPTLVNYFTSFDVILSYLYDPDKIFANNLSSIGVKQLIEGPPRPGTSGHAVDQLAKPLAALGIPLTQRAVQLSFPSPPKAEPYWAIHPSSGSLQKNWPALRWRELIKDLLIEMPTCRVAILGGEADAHALGLLRSLSSQQRVEFFENLPLPQLAKQLAGASFYLGHDTGISHLAAVLGVPSLLLFGPSDPNVWAPPHEHVQILRAPEGNLENLKVSTVNAVIKRVRLARNEREPDNTPL